MLYFFRRENWKKSFKKAAKLRFVLACQIVELWDH